MTCWNHNFDFFDSLWNWEIQVSQAMQNIFETILIVFFVLIEWFCTTSMSICKQFRSPTFWESHAHACISFVPDGRILTLAVGTCSEVANWTLIHMIHVILDVKWFWFICFVGIPYLEWFWCLIIFFLYVHLHESNIDGLKLVQFISNCRCCIFHVCHDSWKHCLYRFAQSSSLQRLQSQRR